jgi:hypothetical protein
MNMGQFDAAIGLDKTSLDTGLSQLYADPTARDKLFKGEIKGQSAGSDYTADWDVQAAPQFVLAPPPTDKWQAAINSDGGHPTGDPPADSFQIIFPKFYAKYTLQGVAPVDGTTEVQVYAEAAISDDKLTLTPLAIWIDESHMSGWDKFILNFILANVLTKATTMLAGLTIPPLSFADIDLSPPVMTITNGQLILASSLTPATPDISGFTWPQKDLFILLSQDFLSKLADKLETELKDTEIADSGEKSGGDWTYKVTIASVSNLKFDTSDLTQFTADIAFDWDASCSFCAMSSATSGL